VTAVLETPPNANPEATVSYPRWAARAGALAIDVLPAIAVIATMALLAITTPQWGLLWWVFTVTAVLAFLAMVVNRWVLPPLTGWSLGRAVFGIRIVTGGDVPAGTARLVLRDLAHLLDTISLFVGWLWPLWDARKRTFADLLLRTEARAVGAADTGVRRRAGIVCLVAALLCVAGGGLGYQFEYRQERAVETARDQIAEQGPRIVEQMLSYGAATMKEDFARSQALTTDAYRPQLVAQQQVVEKGQATSNEYWATNSAVLSASQNQGALLVALQGQRGTDPKALKFISATVRVDFDKLDGQWRVSNLTVLKKPGMDEAGG
jgi:Mce-associated membrane protein